MQEVLAGMPHRGDAGKEIEDALPGLFRGGLFLPKIRLEGVPPLGKGSVG